MQINSSSFTSALPQVNFNHSTFAPGNANAMAQLFEIPTIRALDLTFSGFGGFAGGFTDLSNLVGYGQAPLIQFGATETPKGKKPKKTESALLKGSLAFQVASFYLGPDLDGKKLDGKKTAEKAKK